METTARTPHMHDGWRITVYRSQKKLLKRADRQRKRKCNSRCWGEDILKGATLPPIITEVLGPVSLARQSAHCSLSFGRRLTKFKTSIISRQTQTRSGHAINRPTADCRRDSRRQLTAVYTASPGKLRKRPIMAIRTT
jgi:hypothetical protein